MNDLGKVGFEFADKGKPLNTCVHLSGEMQIFDQETIPQIFRSRYIRDTFDKDVIKQISELLCDHTNCFIAMRSKTFTDKTDLKAEWYDTPYKVEDFSESLIAKMKNPSVDFKKKKLDLPPANPMIPKNFDLLPKTNPPCEKPELIQTWDDAMLWYMKDDKFERPKAYVSFKVYTGDLGFGSNPEKRMFAKVWESVLGEYLNEFTYMAECAKLDSEVSVLHDNVQFDFNGFNDSMPDFICETVKRMQAMRDANVKQEFEHVKERLLLQWENHYLNQSYQQMLPLLETAVTNC